MGRSLTLNILFLRLISLFLLSLLERHIFILRDLNDTCLDSQVILHFFKVPVHVRSCMSPNLCDVLQRRHLFSSMATLTEKIL